jgi:hypothetical protein
MSETTRHTLTVKPINLRHSKSTLIVDTSLILNRPVDIMILMPSNVTMGRLEKKSFNRPDEVRTPPNTKMEIVRIGDRTVTKFTWQPGWKWSQDIKPLAKTESCQIHHFGYLEAGRMRTVSDDGTEIDLEPGDIVDVPPGHDGWVVGNEPAIFYEFGSLLKRE